MPDKIYDLGDPEPIAEEVDGGWHFTQHGEEVSKKQILMEREKMANNDVYDAEDSAKPETSKMTLEQAFERKLLLEHQITNLLREFEAETELTIISVESLSNEDGDIIDTEVMVVL